MSLSSLRALMTMMGMPDQPRTFSMMAMPSISGRPRSSSITSG